LLPSCTAGAPWMRRQCAGKRRELCRPLEHWKCHITEQNGQTNASCLMTYARVLRNSRRHILHGLRGEWSDTMSRES
jgi:hypothetical protein